MSRFLSNIKRENKKGSYLLLIGFTLAVVGLACNLPFLSFFRSEESSGKQVSSDQVNISIVKSLTARAQRDQAEKQTGADQEEASEDSREEQPTATDTPTITPSPTITQTPTITLTPTPEKAVAYVSENTNCREGPQDIYGLIHTFMAGDWVDLIGKNQEETHWYVQDQEGGFTECWMWIKYTTPEGNTANLPVFTPRPTPTPIVAFVITYKGTTGGTQITVKIQNTGNTTLESYQATFKDTVTSENLTQTKNQFGSVAKIPVGKSSNITSASFSASTIGHKIKVTIKACSDDSLAGWCSTFVTTFKSK
jgi:hypothetical protein